DRLRRTPAGSTTLALDGYGLRGQLPARPPQVASIRFLYVRPRFCYPLPSDAASRRCPCVLANPSPPSGWIGDFHPNLSLMLGPQRTGFGVGGPGALSCLKGWFAWPGWPVLLLRFVSQTGILPSHVRRWSADRPPSGVLP